MRSQGKPQETEGASSEHTITCLILIIYLFLYLPFPSFSPPFCIECRWSVEVVRGSVVGEISLAVRESEAVERDGNWPLRIRRLLIVGARFSVYGGPVDELCLAE